MNTGFSGNKKPLLQADFFIPLIRTIFAAYMQRVKRLIKRVLQGWLYRDAKSGNSKQKIMDWVNQFQHTPPVRLSDTSFDVFTYHGEDGILFYLLSQLKELPKYFVDVGSGDCIISNCANLAYHFGWQGVFIDKDRGQIRTGKRFYRKLVERGAALEFIEAEVNPDNINKLIAGSGNGKQAGLLSIDIDGNDYWVWKAISVIQPAIVVIEAKVEFGKENVIVPYGPHNHRSVDIEYNGASVAAITKLGKTKGYKLVGANKQGYNLFFVKQDSPVPEVSAASVLDDPSIARSFYPGSFFTKHKFEQY